MNEPDQNTPFSPPIHKANGFNCPHCGAFSHQEWFSIASLRNILKGQISGGHTSGWHFADCNRCKKYSVWFGEKMIYPSDLPTRPPNPDFNTEIKSDYIEAASILNQSPRGATALLRLCVQNLCKQLGEVGENINQDIGNLVKKGLDEEIQQALDAIRVTGNNAVHPGQMDLKDDKETALALFDLLNLIGYEMISRKNKVKRIFQKLPQAARDAIEKRDKNLST